MAGFLLDASRSLLVIVDVQPSFNKAIPTGEQVVQRCCFLAKVAEAFGVPRIATEQNPGRMAGTDPRVIEAMGEGPIIEKMCFSCGASETFMHAVRASQRDQVVLCGIETLICVNQTAHHLLEAGLHVALAVDALGARSEAMHEISLTRMRDAGAVVTHSEAIAYEWCGSADAPQFKALLKLVKEFGASAA